LQTARIIDAEYEWLQHVPIALEAGATAGALEAIVRGELSSTVFDDAQRAVLQFTTELVHVPRPIDATFEALREHLSDRQIVELILAVGAYTLLGRLITALDVDLDQPRGLDVLAGSQRSMPT
jgi:alkylhydroperoxidase family enzyme